MDAQFAQTDVIIIGGGMAGLSAACYLARAGMAVTLFEKASSLGGRASTQNYDRYAFNRGAHALYTGGPAEQVLQELGITPSGHRPKDLFVLREGKLHLFPASLPTLLRTTALDIGDKLELARLFSSLPQLKSQAWAEVSVQAWLEHTVRRPRVRQFMTAFAYTNVYSTALDLVSAEVLIAKLQNSLKHPVLYIDDGWQTLVEGLRKVAEQAGVNIVSSTRVETVIHKNGYVQGVRLRNGNLVQASAVIIATSPRDAAKLVDAGSGSVLSQIVDPLIPVRVACLDVALRHLPNPRYPIVQDLEHPRFLTAQSHYAHIAPTGGALIYTFKQLDPRSSSDPREDEHDLEDFLDTVQPGWREVLVKRVYLPQIEASGLLPLASSGGYAGRPGPQVPGIAHLYLVGDWIGKGFLVDASMDSARQVAQMLLQDSSLTLEKSVAI